MIYFWIRRQVRKIMKPVHQRKAETYSRNLTAIYVLSAWSCCFIMLMNYKKAHQKLKEIDPVYALTAKNPGIYYGRILQAPNMQMYKFENGELTKAGVYELEKDDVMNQFDRDFFGEEVEKETSIEHETN